MHLIGFIIRICCNYCGYLLCCLSASSVVAGFWVCTKRVWKLNAIMHLLYESVASRFRVSACNSSTDTLHFTHLTTSIASCVNNLWTVMDIWRKITPQLNLKQIAEYIWYTNWLFKSAIYHAGTMCALVMRIVWQWPCVTISTVITSHEQLWPWKWWCIGKSDHWVCMTSNQCISVTTYSLKCACVLCMWISTITFCCVLCARAVLKFGSTL
jgi:hypothetical protein